MARLLLNQEGAGARCQGCDATQSQSEGPASEGTDRPCRVAHHMCRNPLLLTPMLSPSRSIKPRASRSRRAAQCPTPARLTSFPASAPAGFLPALRSLLRGGCVCVFGRGYTCKSGRGRGVGGCDRTGIEAPSTHCWRWGLDHASPGGGQFGPRPSRVQEEAAEAAAGTRKRSQPRRPACPPAALLLGRAGRSRPQQQWGPHDGPPPSTAD